MSFIDDILMATTDYWPAQKRMKKELQQEMPNVKHGDSMKDTPYDRANAFSTGLLFMNMYPMFENGWDTKRAANLGKVYEYGRALVPTSYDFSTRWEDAKRDTMNNEAAYKIWDQIQAKEPGRKLTETEMKDMGKMYAKGLLSDEAINKMLFGKK